MMDGASGSFPFLSPGVGGGGMTMFGVKDLAGFRMFFTFFLRFQVNRGVHSQYNLLYSFYFPSRVIFI